MPITELKLKKWRMEALQLNEMFENSSPEQKILSPMEAQMPAYIERILKMTQELLDQHLLRKK